MNPTSSNSNCESDVNLFSSLRSPSAFLGVFFASSFVSLVFVVSVVLRVFFSLPLLERTEKLKQVAQRPHPALPAKSPREETTKESKPEHDMTTVTRESTEYDDGATKEAETTKSRRFVQPSE